MIEFFADNWLWIVLAGGFVWMHTGRGGCGSHDGHGEHHARDSASSVSDDPDRDRAV